MGRGRKRFSRVQVLGSWSRDCVVGFTQAETQRQPRGQLLPGIFLEAEEPNEVLFQLITKFFDEVFLEAFRVEGSGVRR